MGILKSGIAAATAMLSSTIIAPTMAQLTLQFY
jgi:hypothetical protein